MKNEKQKRIDDLQRELDYLRDEVDELFKLVEGMHDSDTGIRELTLEHLSEMRRLSRVPPPRA